jgi:hypothetical protein
MHETTPLHHTMSRQEVVECTALLLERRWETDMNAMDDDGDTPLHDACRLGSLARVRLLLDAGARTDARDDDLGTTPLHIACDRGRVGCVRLLLEAGAATQEVDASGRTATVLANFRGNLRCVSLIRRVDWLRAVRGVGAGVRLSLDWTVDTHELLADADRRLLQRAVGALLLVDARREGGGTLGREGALAAVAGLARLMGV